jgi:hypothetical protein
MSLIGWIAGTASAAFAFAYVLSTMVLLAQGGVTGGGILYNNTQLLGIIAGGLLFFPCRYSPGVELDTKSTNVGEVGHGFFFCRSTTHFPQTPILQVDGLW